MPPLNPTIFVSVLAATYILLLCVEFVASWWMKKGFYSGEYLIINLSLASLQQIFGVLNQAIFIGGFVFVQTHYSIQILLHAPEIASGWPIWFSGSFPFGQFNLPVLMNWILVLVMADFCQYWLHRLSHEVNILWAGHIVHHSNTEYNYGVAIRQSFLEGFYTWIFYLPLAFVGIPWELFIAAYTLSLLWQFFVHTQFIDKMGILEKWMATPSHHRAHHGKNEIYIDKNYGALFIVWDKLFGTFQEETEPVEYGIKDPLRSNHLIWINTHQHIRILQLIKNAKGLSAQLKVIFSLPSYRPDGVEFHKSNAFQLQFSKQIWKQWYVFITFLCTSIAGLLWINVYKENPSVIHYVFMASVLIANLLTLSGLLEERQWANVVEITKLCLILIIGIFLLLKSNLLVLGIIMIVFAILTLSFAYFLSIDYKRLIIINLK